MDLTEENLQRFLGVLGYSLSMLAQGRGEELVANNTEKPTTKKTKNEKQNYIIHH
jgi:hypothetical protein